MKKSSFFIVVLLGFILVGCGGGDSSSSNFSSSKVPTIPTTYTPNDGRLLASQCAQCHGTNGYSVSSWDSIAGEGDLIEEFREYPLSHIMGAQAQGYSDSEVALMQDYLSTLSDGSSKDESEEKDDENEEDDD